MTDVQITGYHTCKTEGGWSFVNAESPFLSRSGDDQWLTQGYYFWTDSDYFAHMWGRTSYNNDYVVVKCQIVIDSELLLDLVGSTSASIYFQTLLTKFRVRLKKIAPDKEPTVHTIIAYWREQNKRNKLVFPFLAVKVQDHHSGATLEFTGKGRHEFMHVGIPRQQICLFEKGLPFLEKKELIYPDEFAKRCKA